MSAQQDELFPARDPNEYLGGLIASPKQTALSSSGQPHVRLGIVVGRRMQRVDMSIDELRALIHLSPDASHAARMRLHEALMAALPGRRT